MLSLTHTLLMPVQLLVLIVGALSWKKLQAAANTLNIGCLNLLRAGLYTISRWCWGLEGISLLSTARFPVNQYQQLLFLPFFLPSQKLSLQCSCGVLPLFQDPFIPTALLLWAADSSSDSTTFAVSLACFPVAACLKTVKSSLRVGESLMHQMKYSLFPFPSPIFICLYLREVVYCCWTF